MEKNGELTQRQLLRQEKREQRQAVSIEERQAIGQRIAKRLMALYPVQEAERLMAFVPLADEIDLQPFLQLCLDHDKELWLPRVSEENKIEAVRFTGWENMSPSAFGVSEPIGPAAEPRELHAIIVPGLVFDPQGYRLGYGRAYYDQFLAPLPEHIFKCGVAYEFQVVDQTWPQAHDVRLDWILTEYSEIAVNMDFF